MIGVVTGGLDSPYVALQGYAVGSVTLTVDPIAVVLLVNGDITITASLAADWVASGGSLVVAGDDLSAVYTAPGTAGTYTITVTDSSDPGNQVTLQVVVLDAFNATIVNSAGAGGIVDSRVPGAYH